VQGTPWPQPQPSTLRFDCSHHGRPQVTAVLKQLLPREKLDALPVYALGASSGGAFVLMLAHRYPLAGTCGDGARMFA
jgi:hypothetical protein